MPLPSRNASFQRRSFEGFKTGGSAKVESSFEPFIHGRGTRITPRSGSYFARLDGTGLSGSGLTIDSDGFRRGRKSADFKDYAFANGFGRTAGGQGAWLTCEEITLDPGESLFFDWVFAVTLPSYPDDLHNGFAAVRFIGDDGVDQLPMRVFVQARQLANAGPLGGIYQTDWQGEAVPWTGTQPFFGTVQWLVSSGHCMSAAGDQPDWTIARAWPACLIIDHIRLG